MAVREWHGSKILLLWGLGAVVGALLPSVVLNIVVAADMDGDGAVILWVVLMFGAPFFLLAVTLRWLFGLTSDRLTHIAGGHIARLWLLLVVSCALILWLIMEVSWISPLAGLPALMLLLLAGFVGLVTLSWKRFRAREKRR